MRYNRLLKDFWGKVMAISFPQLNSDANSCYILRVIKDGKAFSPSNSRPRQAGRIKIPDSISNIRTNLLCPRAMKELFFSKAKGYP